MARQADCCIVAVREPRLRTAASTDVRPRAVRRDENRSDRMAQLP